MGCKRLSKNKYKITIEQGYDAFGKRRRKVETFNGAYTEAKAREIVLNTKYYKKGNVVNAKEYTFKNYSGVYLKYCKSNNLGMITISSYERLLRNIVPLVGQYKLYEISPYMLDRMYQKLKIGKKGKGLSYYSMYDYFKIINAMFNQAVKWEFIERNPNSKAKKPKKEKVEKNFYNLEQTTKLLSCLGNERIKYNALLRLAVDSGARRGEIVALRWKDVDFENNTIKIDNSLKVVDGVVDEKKAKTHSSIRVITLSESTIKVLMEYKDWQDDYIKDLCNKWKGSDRVFISRYGEHMNPATCLKILNKVVKKYDLPHITFHELRHTSASILIHKGINPKAVSKRLGHSNSNITLDIYSHAFDIAKKESAEVFDEIMKNA